MATTRLSIVPMSGRIPHPTIENTRSTFMAFKESRKNDLQRHLGLIMSKTLHLDPMFWTEFLVLYSVMLAFCKYLQQSETHQRLFGAMGSPELFDWKEYFDGTKLSKLYKRSPIKHREDMMEKGRQHVCDMFHAKKLADLMITDGWFRYLERNLESIIAIAKSKEYRDNVMSVLQLQKARDYPTPSDLKDVVVPSPATSLLPLIPMADRQLDPEIKTWDTTFRKFEAGDYHGLTKVEQSSIIDMKKLHTIKAFRGPFLKLYSSVMGLASDLRRGEIRKVFGSANNAAMFDWNQFFDGTALLRLYKNTPPPIREAQMEQGRQAVYNLFHLKKLAEEMAADAWFVYAKENRETVMNHMLKLSKSRNESNEDLVGQAKSMYVLGILSDNYPSPKVLMDVVVPVNRNLSNILGNLGIEDAPKPLGRAERKAKQMALRSESGESSHSSQSLPGESSHSSQSLPGENLQDKNMPNRHESSPSMNQASTSQSANMSQNSYPNSNENGWQPVEKKSEVPEIKRLNQMYNMARLMQPTVTKPRVMLPYVKDSGMLLMRLPNKDEDSGYMHGSVHPGTNETGFHITNQRRKNFPRYYFDKDGRLRWATRLDEKTKHTKSAGIDIAKWRPNKDPDLKELIDGMVAHLKQARL